MKNKAEYIPESEDSADDYMDEDVEVGERKQR